MQIKQIKKLFLTSALAMTMLSPAMADVDIAAGANTADCDSDVLKTTSGSANLEANWDPNTITLNWYAGSDSNTPLTVQTGAQTCTYDGAITLPATNPTKPGYTFDHWIVRQIPTFDLSTLDASINATAYGYINMEGTDGENATKYGLTEPGDWASEFSYGIIRGEATCSITGNTSEPQTATTIEKGTGAWGTDEVYCWCKVTGFDAEKDGSYVNTSTPWVLVEWHPIGNNKCGRECASTCKWTMVYTSYARSSFFNGTPLTPWKYEQ